MEFYAATLAELAGRDSRLRRDDSDLVLSVGSHHRAHVGVLESLIRQSGGPVGEARARYALPTPFVAAGDALRSVYRSVEELVSNYAAAFGGISAVGLAPPLGRILFSEASSAAALASRLGSPIPIRAFS